MLRWLVFVVVLLDGGGCVRLLESTAPPAAGSSGGERGPGPAADRTSPELAGAVDRSGREPLLTDGASVLVDRTSPKDRQLPQPEAGGVCTIASNWVCTPQGMGCTTTCGNAVITCTLGMSAKCSCSVAGGAPIQCGEASYQFDCPPCVDVVAANCCGL
jgi:hypothetical protein